MVKGLRAKLGRCTRSEERRSASGSGLPCSMVSSGAIASARWRRRSAALRITFARSNADTLRQVRKPLSAACRARSRSARSACATEPMTSPPLTEITVGSSQERALQNGRSRLSERGLARFEVLGRDADRDRIRSLARRLAESGPEASRLRAAVSQSIAGEPPKKGGILAAPRRSPLVGADLDVTRLREEGRNVEI